MLGRNNIQPPSCLRCSVLRKKRLSSQGRQRGYNKLTFIGEIPRYLKRTRLWNVAPNFTSFIFKKQPANARIERKQFTENASVALEQTILTHAHTKCPSVVPSLMSIFCFSKSKYRKGNMQRYYFY